MASKEMADGRKVSYFNTLVFTIMSSIVAVCLMSLLFFDRFRPAWPFIVASDVGLIAIIVYCLFSIVSVERAVDANRLSGNIAINFDTCPDYFVKITDTAKTGKTYCSNEYVVTDSTSRSNYVMKLYPVDPSGNSTMAFALPEVHDPNVNASQPPAAYDKFFLSALDSDPTMKTASAKCGPIVNSNDGVQGPYQYYDSLPWSYMKSRCEGLS